MHTIVAAGVHVAPSIDLDTVRNACINICEYTAVEEDLRLRVNVKGVAIVDALATRGYLASGIRDLHCSGLCLIDA